MRSLVDLSCSSSFSEKLQARLGKMRRQVSGVFRVLLVRRRYLRSYGRSFAKHFD